jgi:hypothetical protein
MWPNDAMQWIVGGQPNGTETVTPPSQLRGDPMIAEPFREQPAASFSLL